MVLLSEARNIGSSKAKKSLDSAIKKAQKVLNDRALTIESLSALIEYAQYAVYDLSETQITPIEYRPYLLGSLQNQMGEATKHINKLPNEEVMEALARVRANIANMNCDLFEEIKSQRLPHYRILQELGYVNSPGEWIDVGPGLVGLIYILYAPPRNGAFVFIEENPFYAAVIRAYSALLDTGDLFQTILGKFGNLQWADKSTRIITASAALRYGGKRDVESFFMAAKETLVDDELGGAVAILDAVDHPAISPMLEEWIKTAAEMADQKELVHETNLSLPGYFLYIYGNK